VMQIRDNLLGLSFAHRRHEVTCHFLTVFGYEAFCILGTPHVLDVGEKYHFVAPLLMRRSSALPFWHLFTSRPPARTGSKLAQAAYNGQNCPIHATSHRRKDGETMTDELKSIYAELMRALVAIGVETGITGPGYQRAGLALERLEKLVVQLEQQAGDSV